MESHEHMQGEPDAYMGAEGVVYYDEGQMSHGMHSVRGDELALVQIDPMGNDDDDMSLSQPSASEGLPPFEG